MKWGKDYYLTVCGFRSINGAKSPQVPFFLRLQPVMSLDLVAFGATQDLLVRRQTTFTVVRLLLMCIKTIGTALAHPLSRPTEAQVEPEATGTKRASPVNS